MGDRVIFNFNPKPGLWKAIACRVPTIAPSSGPRQDGVRNNAESPLIAKDCSLQNGSDIYGRISAEKVVQGCCLLDETDSEWSEITRSGANMS
jgi:hypothetical protein